MAQSESQITFDGIVAECGVTLELLVKECPGEMLLPLAEYCVPINIVGHALGLSETQLSDIDNDYATTKEKRFALMQEWKRSFSFNATYKKFIEALLTSGKAEQATQVCRLLAAQQETTKGGSDTSAYSPLEPLQQVAEPTPEISDTAELSDSHITQCDHSGTEVKEVEEVLLSQRYDRSRPTTDTDSDSSNERSDLEAKIYALEEKFRMIGENLSEALERNETPMNDLHRYAANLPHRIRRCYEELKENQLSAKTKHTTSVSDFVGVLNDCSNFLNPTLLADAVKKFGDKATKAQMRAYNKKLEDFQKSTTLLQFVTECSWKGVTPKGYAEIELVLETNWEQKTLKDITPPKRTWLLKKVYYGSLRVVFAVTDTEDLEEEDVREYLQNHVKRVFVNGNCVLNFEFNETMSSHAIPEESETIQLTDTPSNIDFRFSAVTYGKNILLSKDGLEVMRKQFYHDGKHRYRGSQYNGVYVATPLRGTCEFEVEVTAPGHDYFFNVHRNSLKIGVSQCPTGTYKHLDVPHKISHTNKDSCFWSYDSVKNELSGDVTETETKYGSMDLQDLKKGDRVAVRLSQKGELNFFLNGLDQGIAARNVYREGWDVYPVICLDDDYSAVKITRAVISDYGHPHLKGHTKHENVSPHHIQFGFHPVTGKNIMLLEDGLYARRIDPEAERADGVVYGAVPIKHHGVFEVIITEYEHGYLGINETIPIGVMRLPSNTKLERLAFVPRHSEYGNNHFVWTHDRVINNLTDDHSKSEYGHVNLFNLKEGDKLGLRISSDGSLSFFVNGKSQGVALRGLLEEDCDIYPLVDVCHNCHAVKITRAETHEENEVPDLQDVCVEKIARCLDWSSKDVNLLPLPQRLKNQIEHYIDYLYT